MRNNASAYSCHGFMRPDGGWRRWEFAPGTSTVRQHMQRNARDGGLVLFESVQRFSPPVGSAGILHWRDVSSQYRGANGLPHIAPLYFDIDCENGLSDALILTQALYEFFTGELEIAPQHVSIYFSGSKGAHLLVSPEALGIKASVTLTMDMKPIALTLCTRLARAYGSPELSADDRVYSLPRMLRSANQLNPRSGLYKIRLTPEELAPCDVEVIKSLASSPRHEPMPFCGPLPISPKATAWWARELQKVQEPREFAKTAALISGITVRPDGFMEDELLNASLPGCMRSILKSSPPPGKRNRFEMQIACWAHAAKQEERRALSILSQWIAHNRSELTASQANQRASGIVHSAWASKYGFSCAASRAALGVIGMEPDCISCRVVKQKHPKMISSLRVSEEALVPEVFISMEEARKYALRLAITACAC